MICFFTWLKDIVLGILAIVCLAIGYCFWLFNLSEICWIGPSSVLLSSLFILKFSVYSKTFISNFEPVKNFTEFFMSPIWYVLYFIIFLFFCRQIDEFRFLQLHCCWRIHLFTNEMSTSPVSKTLKTSLHQPLFFIPFFILGHRPP